MIFRYFYCTLFFLFLHSPLTELSGQQIGIGFYNLENLFDVFDDSLTIDEEFTPNGLKNWTPKKYQDKIGKMARVIHAMETARKQVPLIMIGVCEIENRTVLEDLVQNEQISSSYYKIVHHNSNDPRGVDVGLLYRADYFTVLQSKSIKIPLFERDSSPRLTRDILLVKGKLGTQMLYVLVNHWPSRRGGEVLTTPYRIIAAQLNKHLADSILQLDPTAGIIIMGDLNDNPDDISLMKGLETETQINQSRNTAYFNPFYANYKNGEGSTAYDDSWNLFDQMILSGSLLNKSIQNFHYTDHQIFRRAFMLEKNGHFRNYPKRTFSGNQYIGGFSDHFPVICYFDR